MQEISVIECSREVLANDKSGPSSPLFDEKRTY
jgi:hypothetical protein